MDMNGTLNRWFMTTYGAGSKALIIQQHLSKFLEFLGCSVKSRLTCLIFNRLSCLRPLFYKRLKFEADFANTTIQHINKFPEGMAFEGSLRHLEIGHWVLALHANRCRPSGARLYPPFAQE